MSFIAANGALEPRAFSMSLSGMRLRVLSAIVLAVPVLLSVYIGYPLYDLVFSLVALVMVLEWDRLCGTERRDAVTWVFAAAVLTAVMLSIAGRYVPALWSIPVGFVVIYATARGLHRELPLLAASGAFYIGIPVVALLWLRRDSADGMATIFWLLAVVWATDTAALFAGRAIRGPKLAPSISPNKTWAGFFGGVIAAAVVSMIAGLWLGLSSVMVLVAVGAVLSVASQAGDLLESRVKRFLNVKDSGDIIPGHGGIFDRVDGLLTAAPVLAVIYLLVGGGGGLWR